MCVLCVFPSGSSSEAGGPRPDGGIDSVDSGAIGRGLGGIRWPGARPVDRWIT